MGEREGRERHAECAFHPVALLVAVNDAAAVKLRIGDRLAHGAHTRGRHVARLQELFPFVGGAGEHDLREHRNLARVVGVALVVGALDHLGAPQHGPQAALLAQVTGAEHDQAVLGLERAVGGVRMAIAVRLGMHAVAQIAGEMGAHQDHRHIEHGHVDALPAPGPLALQQRRRERERARHAGGVVDHRRAELHRMHVLRAGHRHDPGRGLDHVVIGGLVAARPLLAEGRERGVDQPRVDRGQRVIAQPQGIERAGPVILDEHIGGGDELLEDLAVFLLLEVERNRALVGGLRQEARAHVAAVEVLVGAGGAALVGIVGMLDLDHVRAQHGELVGRERPRQHVRDVDHPDAFERTRHPGLPCDWAVIAFGNRNRDGTKRNRGQTSFRIGGIGTALRPAFRRGGRGRGHGRDLGRGVHVAVPALGEGGGNVELVEHARDDVIDDVVDGLRMVVEGRHRRHDRHAHARELEHVLEMHLGERRLAHHQDEPAALLDHHVGGAVHQVLAVAVGDAGERAHGARDHHHALGLERAGGDRRAHVALAVHHAGKTAHLLDGIARLVLEGALRPLRDDEVALDVARLERLQHPHAENCAGRAGHADDETPHSFSSAGMARM